MITTLKKELVEFEKDAEFSTTIAQHILKISERIEPQKKLIAHLKRDGQDTRDAYFLLVTLKTIVALLTYHRAMARKILVCVVPTKN